MGNIFFHSSLDCVQNAFAISGWQEHCSFFGFFYNNSWLSHLNSNCLPFSIPEMLGNEYRYNWLVHLLREASSKDCILTSTAAFSALFLVVGLGQGMAFLYNPYTQPWRYLPYSFMPLLALSPLLVCFRGVLQIYSRSPAPPCLFPIGLALVAVLFHTNSTGSSRNSGLSSL